MIVGVCVNIDKEVWRGSGYAVYAEYSGFFDGYTTILYKRNGLVERRQFDMFNGVFLSKQDSFEYTPIEDLDCIEEHLAIQNTVQYFESPTYDTLHFHHIYRLSNGYRYDGLACDSIQRLIENAKRQTQI